MKKPKRTRSKTIYYFYILKCADNTLYSGITKNLANRTHLHNSGNGSAYVRSRGGGKIVYSEPHKTLSKALRREIEVKKLTRMHKLVLINKGA